MAVSTVTCEVAGRKEARLQTVLNDKVEMFLYVCVNVVQEGVRFCTYYFMDISNRPRDHTRYPALLDLIWPEESILWVVIQYYSSLLTGESPRLAIIYSSKRCVPESFIS